MTPVLAVLRDRFGLESITPTSFQAAGGSGQKGMDELAEQAAKLALERELLRRGGRPEALPTGQVFPHPVAFNVVPQCMGFTESGYTVEELKLRTSRARSSACPSWPPTDLRPGAGAGRSLAVGAGRSPRPGRHRGLPGRLPGSAGRDRARRPGRRGVPDPAGVRRHRRGVRRRIRADLADPRAVLFWSVADNLRKGAALNAVQIAEPRESLDRRDS